VDVQASTPPALQQALFLDRYADNAHTHHHRKPDLDGLPVAVDGGADRRCSLLVRRILACSHGRRSVTFPATAVGLRCLLYRCGVVCHRSALCALLTTVRPEWFIFVKIPIIIIIVRPCRF